MSQKTAERISDIINVVSNIIKSKNYPDLPIDKNPPIGDFALICFPAAKLAKKDPNTISEDIGKELEKEDFIISANNEKGYCNITIDWTKICVDFLREIQQDDYGKGNIKPEKILIEHTSANPTGPFHMGRARIQLLVTVLLAFLLTMAIR